MAEGQTNGTQTGEEGTPPPNPAGNAGGTGGGEPQRYGQESTRFRSSEQSGGEIPEGLPDRFLKDGKPDWSNLTKSYVELDRAFKSKTEDLKEQLKAEMFKDRPEKADDYKIPEGLDGEAPLLGWWRDQAHTMGLSQKQFDEGIARFVEHVGAEMDPAKEIAKLGENGQARVDAVDAWVNATFTEPDELKAVLLMGSTAAGVKVLEKLMNGGKTLVMDDDPVPNAALTADELRKMQGDPRYWDSNKRDPAFVKKIEEGWQKLAASGQ